ncbi:hypothetical protein NUSPORA_00206 [Nucleospora cyclopteri]
MNLILALLKVNIIRTNKSDVAGISEFQNSSFSYKPNVFNDKIELYNTLITKEKLFLRSSIGEGSLIRWENKNETENWAMTFTIDRPHLSPSEFAGIYLYYTKDKIYVGDVNGADGKFDGFFWGLEAKGAATDLVFGIHDGKKDFKEVADFHTKRDSFNPRRLKDVDEITIKVISTNVNTKVELYNKNNLLYDNFKFMNAMGSNKPGKYFGIIADYKNTASSKAYAIKNVDFYSRSENEEYSAYKSYAEQLKNELINRNDIKHGDNDVKELIHKSELLQHLIKRNLGELPNTTIKIAKNVIEKDLKFLADKMNKLESIRVSKDKKLFSTKLNEFDIKINQLKRSVNDFEYFITHFSDKQATSHSKLQYIILIVGIIGVFTFVIRELYNGNKN